MNTKLLDDIITLTRENTKQINDLYAMIEDWKQENHETCLRYCTHRTTMTTDRVTGQLVCAHCNRA